MIQINGNAKEQYDGKTLEDVLAGEGYEKSRIAMDGDVVEIVSFVGGGC